LYRLGLALLDLEQPPRSLPGEEWGSGCEPYEARRCRHVVFRAARIHDPATAKCGFNYARRYVAGAGDRQPQGLARLAYVNKAHRVA